MSLDPTAREANLRDSIKKFFVDNIKRTSRIDLVFDKGLSTPALHAKKQEVVKWVSINIGPSNLDTVSDVILDIHCCTRNDPENFGLSQLVDTVLNYLVDSNHNDGMRRIPFYQSAAGGFSNWTLIGALMVTDIIKSGDYEGPDGSKVKTLTVTVKWASKI